LIASPTSASATKFLLRFAKRGDLRLVSHHDLMRCLERALRRASVPMARSQGFNPRPKMSFPLPLGLGIEGHREVLELELSEAMAPEELLARLRAAAPSGFDFLDVEPAATGPGTRPARAVAAVYALNLPLDRLGPASRAVSAFLASDRWPFVRRRPDRTVEADLRPFVLEAAVAEDASGVVSLRFTLRIAQDGSARPEEFLAALGLADLTAEGSILARADVVLATSDDRPSPLAATPAAEPAGPGPRPSE
jgi:radical SAM-linked protein